MFTLGILIASLLITGAATLLEGLLGADLTPGPVAMLATAIAAVVVWRTRTPLVGLIIAAWLALGPLAMPWTSDNLGRPQHAGVFIPTIVQLVANATALIVGVRAQIEHMRRTGRPRAPAHRTEPAAPQSSETGHLGGQ
jgi:hypothetical protein